MVTDEEVSRFLDTWTTSWVKRYGEREPIFHEGGGVRYPGSDGLFDPDSQPAMTDILRKIAPDLEMRLVNWAVRDDILFGEWTVAATINGRRFAGSGCNRFTLKGDKALEAISYIDRLALVEFLDPSRDRPDLAALIRSAADA